MTVCPRPIPAALVLLVLAAPAFAGPGDPLEDGSCTYIGARLRKCEERIVKGLGNGLVRTLACHQKQARAAGFGIPFDDGACELTASLQLRTFSAGCDPEVVRAATGLAAELDALLDGLVNRTLYCDAASATPIDASGDAAGFVPSTSTAWRCVRKLQTATRALGTGTLKCFVAAARAAFRAKTFDAAACLTKVRTKFDGQSVSPMFGQCAPCLEDGRGALGDGLAAFLRAAHPRAYPCLTGYFLRAGTSLDAAPPTVPDAARETIRRVNRDEPAVFPTFTSAPLAAAATLDATTLVVLHLGANQEMRACADVRVEIERVAPDEARTTLGSGLATGVTVPAATAKPLLPLGLDIALAETAVPAGHRLATTVTVTNRCAGNRAISLDYDGGSTPTRIATTGE